MNPSLGAAANWRSPPFFERHSAELPLQKNAATKEVLAHKLQGKLLLMVGELDKNVDPASTMRVVNALVKADKVFELLVMPGAGHGVARTPYGACHLQDFFVKTFLGNEAQERRAPTTISEP